MVRVKILFDTQGRGGVYVALGFSEAQAEEKQFLPSGNRPENPEIFRFPQLPSPSRKIRRFSWSVSKSFLTRRGAAACTSRSVFPKRKRRKSNSARQEIAGKSADFQISAGLFPFHENPQIFMVRVKKDF